LTCFPTCGLDYFNNHGNAVDSWTVESVEKTVWILKKLLLDQQNGLVAYLIKISPVALHAPARASGTGAYQYQKCKAGPQRRRTEIPPYLNNGIPHRPEDLAKCRIVLTAGGDGTAEEKPACAREFRKRVGKFYKGNLSASDFTATSAHCTPTSASFRR